MSDNLYLYLEFLVFFCIFCRCIKEFYFYKFYLLFMAKRIVPLHDTKGVENQVIFFSCVKSMTSHLCQRQLINNFGPAFCDEVHFLELASSVLSQLHYWANIILRCKHLNLQRKKGIQRGTEQVQQKQYCSKRMVNIKLWIQPLHMVLQQTSVSQVPEAKTDLNIRPMCQL